MGIHTDIVPTPAKAYYTDVWSDVMKGGCIISRKICGGDFGAHPPSYDI